MPHTDLPRYQDGFFQKFVADLPSSPQRSALEQQALAGEYVRYSGAALTPLPNASITPQFAIRTGEGAAARTYPLVWLVEKLDVATDSRETMTRILADYRSPAAASSSTPETMS